MTPACPRLLDMINDFVVLRFWARAPRGFKRYRSYIILLLLLLTERSDGEWMCSNIDWHCKTLTESEVMLNESVIIV